MRSIFTVIALSVGLAACAEFGDDRLAQARQLVARAADTVEGFRTDPALVRFGGYMRGARGIVVLPSVVKAGFVGAAEVGNGVLLARGADGTWSDPAFYTLGAASVGLQIGIQYTEMVFILKSDRAVRSVIEHQGKLGADLGLSVGLVGAGMEASTTTNLGVDIVALTNSIIGAYGGASFEGAVLARRMDLNTAYYGAGATPQAIVIERTLRNPGADPLKAALADL
jgi:lipid-binding SYLF domain-containing protein